jgi:hypothetical protein
MVMPCNRPGLKRLWDYKFVILAEYLCIFNEEYFIVFIIMKGTETFVFPLFFCNLFDCEGVYFLVLAVIGKHMVHGLQVLLDAVMVCGSLLQETQPAFLNDIQLWHSFLEWG